MKTAPAVFNGESVTLSEDTFGINYGKADSALESSYVYDEDTNGANPGIRELTTVCQKLTLIPT